METVGKGEGAIFPIIECFKKNSKRLFNKLAQPIISELC